jgi:hypothetical protein
MEVVISFGEDSSLQSFGVRWAHFEEVSASEAILSRWYTDLMVARPISDRRSIFPNGRPRYGLLDAEPFHGAGYGSHAPRQSLDI